MAINRKCPKCGSTKVQLSDESTKKHGCLYFMLFGIGYLLMVICKWLVGMLVFICYDWWMAIVQKATGKGHVWQSRKFFSGRRRIYFCHDCGHNFKA